MIAKLHLHHDNFRYNGTSSPEEVGNRLRALVSDMVDVVYEHNKENEFLCTQELPNCEVCENITLMDIAPNCLQREELGVFYTIIGNTSEEENIPLNNLKSLCTYNENEEFANAMLVLNATDAKLGTNIYQQIANMQFDSYEVVYDKSSWLHLRRQILGNHPGSPNSFLSESKEYFPRIEFHENCSQSLTEEHLITCPRKWVKYLSALNDFWEVVWKEHTKKDTSPQANVVLEDLSGRCGLDRVGSIERNSEKKDILKFSFSRDAGGVTDVYCELHLKITSTDENYKGRTIKGDKGFNPRMYFAAPIAGVAGGRILMGSIGPHL